MKAIDESKSVVRFVAYDGGPGLFVITPRAFAPSSVERANPPVRLSVWADDVDFDDVLNILPTRTYTPIWLSVGDIIQISNLGVVDDPRGTLYGHYGITGLDIGNRNERRNARVQLSIISKQTSR